MLDQQKEDGAWPQLPAVRKTGFYMFSGSDIQATLYYSPKQEQGQPRQIRIYLMISSPPLLEILPCKLSFYENTEMIYATMLCMNL